MCRTGGRRCPSSLGRSHGGTRPTRDTYTSKTARLCADSASLSRVSRGLTEKALGFLPKNEKNVVPKDVLTDTRESLSASLLHAVSANPMMCSSDTVDSDAARRAYEDWRLHHGGSEKWAVPFHRLSKEGQSAVRASLNAAVREVSKTIPREDIEQAQRNQGRDLDKASVRALSRYHGHVQDDSAIRTAIDDMKYGDNHLPELLLADALVASNISVHGQDAYATRHWLRERGIDPDDVKLVMSPGREMVVSTGDTSRDKEITDLLKLEWDGDGDPNGRELRDRLVAVNERSADRGVHTEFFRTRSIATAQLPSSVTRALQDAQEIARDNPKPAGRPTSDYYAKVGACVGGGDIRKAKHLLSGKATREELADEIARLGTIPARYLRPGTVGALEDLDKRAVLIEAGVHPRHLDSAVLPPEAAARVRERVAQRIVAAGEDYYSEEPMEDEWMERSLEDRAHHLTSTLTALNGKSEHYSTIGSDMGFLVDEATAALGRQRLSEREAPIDPRTTMDPLF